jgi:hypothetical protein
VRASSRSVQVAVPVLAAVLAGAVVLAGCGGADPDASPTSDSSTSTATGTSSSAPADGGDTGADGATDAPPFPATTDPDTASPSGDSLVTVTDIRIGRHDGFDRVVFEVDGTGAPGWDVRYVDDPASQGSGDPVAVEGEAVLQVTLTGIGLPYDTGVDEWTGPDPLAVPETETVTEVVWDASFEGQSVAFVGTTAQTPFRVYLLESPARVVVEVADQG